MYFEHVNMFACVIFVFLLYFFKVQRLFEKREIGGLMGKKKKDRVFPVGFMRYINAILKKQRACDAYRKCGGSMFNALKIRLTKRGRVEGSLVIYAIQTIKSEKDARSFYLGYAKDIRENPRKYPKKAGQNPAGYARYDISVALSLHFPHAPTRSLWKKAINIKDRDMRHVWG
jgi:hypothetical protein